MVELRCSDSVLAVQALVRFVANVVEALETSPSKGKTLVRWLLITDQFIETAEGYWQIEEYFEALKTGMTYMKLQHKQAKRPCSRG